MKFFFSRYPNSLIWLYSATWSRIPSPQMSTSRRVHRLSERFIGLLQSVISTILEHKFLFSRFGTHTQDRDENWIGSAESPSSFRPNPPPFTPPINVDLQSTQRYKRKALLIGVESANQLLTERGLDTPTNLRPLKGPHKDIRDMRQFLIGRFDKSIPNIYWLVHW